MTSKTSKLISAIIICQLVGVIGSFFTKNGVDTWYNTISKPNFTPPNWLFAPVWIIIFLLMGISLYLIISQETDKRMGSAIAIFAVQLILNIGWSFIFFTLKNPTLAFIEINLLWLAVFFNITIFAKINRQAAFLLIPYLCWLSFAYILNYTIFILNR